MSDKENSFARLPPYFSRQVLYALPCQRVKRTERFVHEQYLGVVYQRTGNGNSLLHTARKLVYFLIGELAEINLFKIFLDLRLVFFFWHSPHLRAERNIRANGKPFVQWGILKHYPSVPIRTVDLLTVKLYGAVCRTDKACKNFQKSALAAAGRTQNTDEFPGENIEADILKRLYRACCAAIAEINMIDCNKFFAFLVGLRLCAVIIDIVHRKQLVGRFV